MPGNPAVHNGQDENAPFPAISEKTLAGNLIKTVDGREVHRFLKVGKDYTNWIKDRIKKFGFIEGVDYLLAEIGEQHPSGTKYRTEYFLTLSMGKELGMIDRSDKGRQIRKYFISIEEQGAPARQMTPAEMFLHNAQMMVTIERQQKIQVEELKHIGAQVERVELAQTVMSSRPADAESITHIRIRIGKMLGLSAATVDAVIRQSPYSPKPAGTVKSSREEAEGSTFVVFWRKDITALFKRFVSECVQVTPTMCTHPYIDGRFRLVKGEAK
ncbi:MAG TPA: antA/AntB antirepressor family protein [Ochrobactrum sp.]|nr:antA/AntB antirepressor family protein [Ochrobactrum sp.]